MNICYTKIEYDFNSLSVKCVSNHRSALACCDFCIESCKALSHIENVLNILVLQLILQDICSLLETSFTQTVISYYR